MSGPGQSLRLFAGTGKPEFNGDGAQAIHAGLHWPGSLVMGPDGSVYLADTQNHCIRRIGPNGTIHTVAGTGSKPGFKGDGGPAIQAHLYAPTALALAPDGSIYIADTGSHVIRQIGPDGIIRTVAGTPKFTDWTDEPPRDLRKGYEGQGYEGDGDLATKAKFNEPTAIALGPDGSLYIADTDNHRIRRVGPDGIITTVAGGGVAAKLDKDSFLGDGGPATKAQLSRPAGLAVGPDGSLYIYDGCYSGESLPAFHRIRRVGPDGMIRTVAGGGSLRQLGDGGPATQARLDYVGKETSGGAGIFRGRLSVDYIYVRGLALGPDGSLYVGDANNRIRRVLPDGVIATAVGGGALEPEKSSRAAQARLHDSRGIAIGVDGTLYVSEVPASNPTGRGLTPGHRLYRLTAPLPGFTNEEIVIASNDGSELYKFSADGRHVETLDTLTQKPLYGFGHDKAGRLAKVEDLYGNVTTIERDESGNPTAIVAPYGQRTTLGLDAAGYVASVANPADETMRFAYGPGGLLTSVTDARGHVSRFTYDELGRLIKDEGPEGGFIALARSEGSRRLEVAITTALKPATTNSAERLPTGEEKLVNQCCCGAETQMFVALDGSARINHPDGSVSTRTEQPDPRWGMQSPLLRSSSLTTPGGRSAVFTRERNAVLADATNPLSLQTLTDTFSINGRKSTAVWDTARKSVTRSTPAGRQSVTTVDGNGRMVRSEMPGLHPVDFAYDKQGRLAAITQGVGDETRVVSIEYNADGRLAGITDPLKRKVRFEHDKAGRVSKQVQPDGREIAFAFDPNGKLKSLTPPGRPAHGFEYTPGNLTKAYQPPSAGADSKDTSYGYNKDKQLTRINRPDGKALDLAYDKVGHLETVTTPAGKITVAFDAKTEQLKSITSPDGSLSYSYDGFLRTGMTWEGTIKGSVTRTFDNEFRVVSRSVNGGPAVENKYDADGLLVKAGGMTLQRDPKNGMPKGTTLGQITTSQEYNGFGEPKRFVVKAGGKDILSIVYERNPIGRIVKKTETVEGKTEVYVYTYDRAGRLSDVTKNGSKVGHYEYDPNGNRLRYEGQLGSFSGSYDAQDRIMQYGDTTFTHTANGELLTRSQGGKTTKYDYDVLGQLRGVELPDGTKIEYLIDGAGHRIGKKVDGKLVQGLLWQDQLKPIAELDGEGNVVSRFIYAGGVNVPAYMEKGGKTYCIVTDHLGSPRLVIDAASGAIAQRMEYDEFGNVLADTSPAFQPFGFAGGIYDPQTRLVRFGARDYDAATGRWTATDPILFEGGDTNLYAYVLNNPTNRRDADGLKPPESAQQMVADGAVVIFTQTPAGQHPLGKAFTAGYATGRAVTKGYEALGGNPGAIGEYAADIFYPPDLGPADWKEPIRPDFDYPIPMVFGPGGDPSMSSGPRPDPSGESGCSSPSSGSHQRDYGHSPGFGHSRWD